MDRLRPVYFGNGESYSDDEEAYDFPSPEPSEYDEDEDEDDPTEDATSVSDASEEDDSSSTTSEEDDEDDASTSGSEDEEEEDPAEADPIPRNRIIHICPFLVNGTRCTSPHCIRFDIEPTGSPRIHEQPPLNTPRPKRALENPEETPLKRQGIE